MCCLQSPEKLQAALEEMSAAVERRRGAAAEAAKRLRASATRSEHVAKVRAPTRGVWRFHCLWASQQRFSGTTGPKALYLVHPIP